MPKEELTDPSVLTWVEDDEISYRGEMFDISYTVELDDLVLFVGHFDKQDDVLFAMLKDMFSENGSPDGQERAERFIWHFEGMPAGSGFSLHPIKHYEPWPVYFSCFDERITSSFLSSSFRPPELS